MKNKVNTLIKDFDVEIQRKNKYLSVFIKFSSAVLVLIFLSYTFMNLTFWEKINKNGWAIEAYTSLGKWEKMIEVHGYSDSYGIDLDYWNSIKIAESLHIKHKRPYRAIPWNKSTYIPIQTFDDSLPLSNEEKIKKLKSAVDLIEKAKNDLDKSHDYGVWRTSPILRRIKFTNDDYAQSEQEFRKAINQVSEVIFAPSEGDDPKEIMVSYWLNTDQANSAFGKLSKKNLIEEIQIYKVQIIRLIDFLS